MKPTHLDTGLTLDELPEVNFDCRRARREAYSIKPKMKAKRAVAKKPKPTVRSLTGLRRALPVSHGCSVPGPRHD